MWDKHFKGYIWNILADQDDRISRLFKKGHPCDAEYIFKCTKKVFSAQFNMKTYALLCVLWKWDRLIYSLYRNRRSVGAVCTNMPRCTFKIKIVLSLHLPEPIPHPPSSFPVIWLLRGNECDCLSGLLVNQIASVFPSFFITKSCKGI